MMMLRQEHQFDEGILAMAMDDATRGDAGLTTDALLAGGITDSQAPRRPGLPCSNDVGKPNAFIGFPTTRPFQKDVSDVHEQTSLASTLMYAKDHPHPP